MHDDLLDEEMALSLFLSLKKKSMISVLASLKSKAEGPMAEFLSQDVTAETLNVLDLDTLSELFEVELKEVASSSRDRPFLPLQDVPAAAQLDKDVRDFADTMARDWTTKHSRVPTPLECMEETAKFDASKYNIESETLVSHIKKPSET